MVKKVIKIKDREYDLEDADRALIDALLLVAEKLGAVANGR